MPNNPLYVEPPAQPEPLRPNELVSYNLLRARRAKGWTQTDLGEMLGRYTGRPWSNASVSAAERAWQGGRPRKFDADEIVAFCQIFDVPYAYFLMPPDESDAVDVAAAEEEVHGPLLRFPIVEYLKCILAVDPPASFYTRAHLLSIRAAGLEFVPAIWDGVASENEVRKGAKTIKGVLGEDGKAAAQRFDRWVEEMQIPPEVVEDLTAARAEQVGLMTAAYLDQQGYLTTPETQRQMEELRRQVDLLNTLLAQQHSPKPEKSD
ncbi:helix-turn-helix transcriptional regulator [Streptomyces sp. BPSDS2]|uniref:helix-turn-helix domain-containing protein n=1 Tax=Streptomyces sp. BPSDS2 TaxID=2571021 RepID=UPI0010C1B16D|nr:helix-turn-helix transcriptional regulator [Streptomyces sp. BPSDS2]